MAVSAGSRTRISCVTGRNNNLYTNSPYTDSFLGYLETINLNFTQSTQRPFSLCIKSISFWLQKIKNNLYGGEDGIRTHAAL